MAGDYREEMMNGGCELGTGRKEREKKILTESFE